MDIEISKIVNSVALSSGKEVASIAKILKSCFNITHFCYIKSFQDGTHLLLSNDSEWIEKFYVNFYNHGAFHKILDSYYSGHVLWKSAQDQTTFNVCRESHNIDHGITIIEKQKDHCEFFCFGTTQDNFRITDFYINNLDLLKRFNAYFKEQAGKLIESASSDRLILPHCYTKSNEIMVTLEDTVSDKIRNSFIQSTHCKRYYLSGSYSNVYLTARELDCLNLITFGNPVKEIARMLNLSARTVETYLNLVKIKLETTSKAGLISKSLRYNQYLPNIEDRFLSSIDSELLREGE